MEELTRSLADWIVRTRWEDLPSSVLDATEVFVTDHFGCALGGATQESSRVITEVVTGWGPRDGPCTVVGRDMRTSAPLAALINGTSGHALELDDTHREGTCHCGVAVVPAALATAEQEKGKSGRDLILAISLGYEVMARVAESLLGKSFWRGFHTTGIYAPFGAAAASGKLLGLNTDQMVSAIGMAASQSSGLQTYRTNGAWNKRFHAGHGAMAGVISAYLARNDYRGPSETFLGPGGWLQAYSYQDEHDAQRITAHLGERWDMLGNAIKAHACCRFAGCVVDAVLEVVKREDLRPEQVAEVVVTGAAYPMKLTLTEPRERKYNPTTVVDAQFSAPFVAALAIVKRRAFADEFTETMIRDRTLLEMAQRVRCEVDAEAERIWPKRFPCEARVTLTDGSVVGARVEWPKGDPENPLTPAELEQKFRALSEPVVGEDRADQLLDVLRSLRHLTDLRPLSSALGGGGEATGEIEVSET